MLSIILPTYNESENITKYIPILHSLFSKVNLKFEILIVDDNSPDKTWKIAEDLSKQYNSVRSFNRIGDKGLSSAVLFGIHQAKYETICVLDADMQHDESIVPKMLEEMKNHDLVIGSRKVVGGEYGEMPFYRQVMSKVADRIANLIIPIPAKDSMSGFFMIRKKLILDNLEKLNPKGFKILLEILCRIPNLKIKEIGYSFRQRVHGKTKLSSMVIIEYFTSLLEIRFNISITATFIKYSFVGIMGVFVNLLFQFLSSMILEDNAIVNYENQFFKPSLAVIVGFEVSLLSNFFLNHFWTFNKTLNSLVPSLLKFHLISILGFLIQISVWAFLFSAWLHYLDSYNGLATYVSNFIGIITAFVSNFYLNKNVTWK
ncbi:glycosyltransferase [Leptospira sp. GIMC2001]|uniref:glycosyltransferase n=1 Tax=Leptospira sp. GIMC2001 TaxID=1513297 RepID=UPI00234963CD|nr:glycosyltransferase family 2 protein [Leptospira sp. GIMC2001]WCL48349.1 glycosyltransferase family 2 protein [Leptospira sp. GIMC2001]